MVETLFAINKRNLAECQNLFRGDRGQEYYRGDYWIEDASVVDVKAERKPVGSSSIILLRSVTKLFFRRTRKHIREDATDLAVLWFVRRGKLVFSNQCGTRAAGPGEFVVTRSMSPFMIECQPEDGGTHEVLHVTVPAHVLRTYLPLDVTNALFLPGDGPELVIAARIFGDLFADDGKLAPDSARTLLETALTLVGHAIRGSDEAAPTRQTVVEKRLEDALRFIEVHLSDPNLSTAMVSRGCGISPRYLSFLLRLKGTSFSQLVWEQRLEKARFWLSREDQREISISEIAYGVGFKSPAHFSRMFKRNFKVNPREFRQCELPDSATLQ